MAEQTEAACLLETGALYGRRLLLRAVGVDPIFAGFKPGAFSLYFGDAPIFHFDRDGRWQRAFCDDRHYLKGLDAAVQTIDRVREGTNLVLKRKTLGDPEAAAFDERVRATALGLIGAIDSGGLETIAPPSRARPVGLEELHAILERIAGWDSVTWSAHREAYLRTYGALPFLPPDCPTPVVLQATLGPEGGRSFGGAPASTHSVRTPVEFGEHVRSVARLIGRRVDQCRSVFLGGSDVLRRPADDIVAYLEILASVFPIDTTTGHSHPVESDDGPPRLGGVHTFLDRFDAPRHAPDTLRTFRDRGLVRVSLGVESGDPDLRASDGKLWTNEALRVAVSDFKAAGIGVGVITLAGAFGEGKADRHLDATADLINSLELGPGDLVSVLDADDLAGPDPTRPTAPGRAARLDALKSRLAPVRTVRKAKVVAYNPEKQGPA